MTFTTWQPEPVDQPVVTPSSLSWLKSIAGELATATLTRLDQTLPWYRDMPPARRAAIGSVAQNGITSFIQWYEDPSSQPWVAADVFGSAPRELLRSISLQETLQVIRVVVEMVEELVVKEHPELHEAILRYSRDIAFSAADVYAKAAEARGLWDARLEALVVDSVISGESSQEISSRVAALGWRADGQVAVLLGTTPKDPDPDAIRKVARKSKCDVLIGIQGRRQVVVIGLLENSSDAQVEITQLAYLIEGLFAIGPLVLGPVVPTVSEASRSARAALAANSVAATTSFSHRPILADELLPERALAGDQLAKATLLQSLYHPIADASTELLNTLKTYLECGRSLEATSKVLFVHANTVRYRLRRIQEILGEDATDPRTAFVLQIALALGAISDSETGVKRD
ncbi:MAG: helix-turn-helix domain-containing protein [Aquiluna sp.]|nr:helix-turn-helix domain-containing protein [Aquiluna sp.]MDP5026009.1 helix-turn-helix domain-containing protein [Aquiluna sp.]